MTTRTYTKGDIVSGVLTIDRDSNGDEVTEAIIEFGGEEVEASIVAVTGRTYALKVFISNLKLKGYMDIARDNKDNKLEYSGECNIISQAENRAPIHVGEGTKLKIYCETEHTDINKNILDCKISTINKNAAAIGGNYLDDIGESAGEIIIMGKGKVEASSYYGAGIGGGYARGNNNGTGGAGGKITIKESVKVKASSNNGAAIGGGNGFATGNGTGGEGGIITIGGTAEVDVTSEFGAGIGGGYGTGNKNGTGGAGGTITIGDGAKVNVDSGYAAGIGGGQGFGNNGGAGGNGGTIRIEGKAKVVVDSFVGGGIGGGPGYGDNTGTGGYGGQIAIVEYSKVESSSTHGAGIGGGRGYGDNSGTGGDGGEIIIRESAEVNVFSKKGSAIGGGSGYVRKEKRTTTGGAGGSITIVGIGKVEAKSEEADDVGGGYGTGPNNPVIVKGKEGDILIANPNIIVSNIGDDERNPKLLTKTIVCNSGEAYRNRDIGLIEVDNNDEVKNRYRTGTDENGQLNYYYHEEVRNNGKIFKFANRYSNYTCITNEINEVDFQQLKLFCELVRGINLFM